MIRVSFVCLGNICRSPTAEGIMVHLVEEAGLEGSFEIDSAGTSGYHVGERPDRRTLATAEGRGVPLPGRSRRFEAADFARFDYVVAMDSSNVSNLRRMAPDAAAEAKVCLLRDFDPESPRGAEVPDPYYGEGGFERVFDICEAGCRGLLRSLRKEHSF